MKGEAVIHNIIEWPNHQMLQLPVVANLNMETVDEP